MKTYISIAFLLMIFSCRKKQQPVPAPVVIGVPEIIVSERIQGCGVSNNSNFTFNQDSVTTGTIFYINSLQGYRTPITLTFGLSEINGLVQKTRWKVGSDPLFRNGQGFDLDFTDPVGSFTVSVYLEWIPNPTGKTRVDTIKSQIRVEETANFTGIYRGVSSESPLDTFSVYLGRYRENIISSDTNEFYGIKNFFKGFQFNLPVLLYSNGFGICQSPPPFLQRYPVAGKYCSQPYGIGMFSKNRDSLTIAYTYVQYEDAVSNSNIRTYSGVFRSARQ